MTIEQQFSQLINKMKKRNLETTINIKFDKEKRKTVKRAFGLVPQ